MKNEDVLEAYKTFLRPILDFAFVIYGCFLTGTQTAEINRMQNVVKKIIYGQKYKEHEIENLEEQRQRLFDQFVEKAVLNPRFSSRWFPLKEKKQLQHQS